MGDAYLRPEDIDYPVAYDWARHYNPSLPPIDDRTEKQRRIDEGVARALAAIEADMHGNLPAPAASTSSKVDVDRLVSRLDYVQTELGEARRRIRDLERVVGGKARTGISRGGVNIDG